MLKMDHGESEVPAFGIRLEFPSWECQLPGVAGKGILCRFSFHKTSFEEGKLNGKSFYFLEH